MDNNQEMQHQIANKAQHGEEMSMGAIKNNNFAQAPAVKESDMTKSQVGGDATAKLRMAVNFPTSKPDQMSGNLMS